MVEETALSPEEQTRVALSNLNKLIYFVNPISGKGFAETKGKGVQGIISDSLEVLLPKSTAYSYDVSGSTDVDLYLQPSATKALAEAGVTQLAEALMDQGTYRQLTGGRGFNKNTL